MNDKAFFDTNVLVYIVGQHDHRTAPAEALVASGGVVSVQVLNELAAVARRKLAMTWPEVEEALTAIRVLCPEPVPLTIQTHETGYASLLNINFTSTMRWSWPRHSKRSAPHCIPKTCRTAKSSTGD